ncbi:MAG: helix-turn-helix domain-containing protein [Tepidisphaeraceae bacterium]
MPPPARARRARRIAVCLDRRSSASVEILRGVLDFARPRGWMIVDDHETAIDGIITDDCRPADTPRPFPAVTVSAGWMGTGDVRLDSAAAESLVGQHFHERGFKGWTHAPEDSAALPRLSACFVTDDAAGLALIRSLHSLGRGVPGEVAVLSLGNDLLTCERSAVPISSVDPNARGIGRRAAARLSRLLRKQPVDTFDLVPPAGVVTRASTDVLAIEDEEVAAAVSYIRQHAAGPVRIGDLMRITMLDRRTLERRFTKALGRSPMAVLRQLRASRAAEWLRTSDRSVAEIATACGFKLPQHLTAAFKQFYAQSPSDYRRIFVEPDERG